MAQKNIDLLSFHHSSSEFLTEAWPVLDLSHWSTQSILTRGERSQNHQYKRGSLLTLPTVNYAYTLCLLGILGQLAKDVGGEITKKQNTKRFYGCNLVSMRSSIKKCGLSFAFWYTKKEEMVWVKFLQCSYGKILNYLLIEVAIMCIGYRSPNVMAWWYLVFNLVNILTKGC